jgi:methionyl-tRNA formyltransferase
LSKLSNKTEEVSPLRIVMMGTGPFAVPSLRAIYESPHEVCALFTRPDRPQKGRTKTPPNPMRALAMEHGTPVHDPESINAPTARMVLASYQPDLLVVCDYGQILKPEVLELARLGGINLHGSLLPKYRGAAPINWALLNGEWEVGVTVIHMTPQLDAGPAIAQASLVVGEDETAAEVEPRLAELGVPLVMESIERLAAGTAKAIPQDASQVTKAPRLKKEQGAIDWHRTAEQIKDQVRALEPWPRTFTFWHRPGGEPLRVILDRVRLAEWYSGPGAPGEVLEAYQDRLLVATGEGAVRIESIQPAGKKAMAAEDFLRGYPVRSGEFFGPETIAAQ